MKGNNKSYDEINKYDFKVHYYMHYAIGTKFEGRVEINKSEYNELIKKINNSSNAMIRAYKTYTVGFYKTPKTYVTQEVDKKVFDCLYSSQRYERNKVKHERERHLNTFFKQEDISKLVSEDNVESTILNKMEDENLKAYLNSMLSEIQSRRFYKNKIEELPLIVIAFEEGKDVAAVKRSVDRAVRNILEEHKKNKKF